MALLAATPTATPSRTTAPLEVPQTQNTAPVLEFICLYTQDLRRKQKRWQDGRLKFHTFNKRVMIYDERSNFVGDTHWRDDGDFTEGEELQLERGGILVEVGECLGKRDQDLTELLGKRILGKENRAAAKLASLPTVASVGFSQDSRSPAAALKPKPLNVLVAPSGHYGRAAVPNTSPFEERRRLENYNHDDKANRPTKRRKVDDSAKSKGGYAQNLLGATLALESSRPPSSATVRYDLPKPSIARPLASSIDLTLDDDDDRNPLSAKAGKVEYAALEARQGTARRATFQRTPPPKSGYASTLTGAALSLTTPSATSVSRSFKTLATERPRQMQQHGNGRSSAAHSNGAFINTDSSLDWPGTIRDSASEGNQPPKTTNKPGIDKGLKKKPSQSAINAFQLPDTTPCDTSGSAPEQPVSSLRIKAKPPRKMMMLMDGPSSGLCNGPRDKFGMGSINVTEPPRLTDGPILSQDTMHLNSFCQNQDAKRQAYLNGKRRPTDLDCEEDGEQSCFVADNADNHRITDLPSLRKGNDAELTTLTALGCSPGPTPKQLRSAAPPKILPSKLDRATGAVTLNQDTNNVNIESSMISVNSNGGALLNYASGPKKPKLASGELVVKTALELASKQRVAPDVKFSTGLGFQSANTFNATCLARNTSISTSNNTGQGLPSFKLANPATRGKSAQTSVTTDSNGAEAEPPTGLVLERTSPRPVPEFATRVSLSSGLSVGGEHVSDPWSRESFDLFGHWLPPGRKESADAT